MKTARAASVPRVLMEVRDLIAQGVLRPGERVAELAVVARLGLSRTPVRAALAKLQDEGLLEALPGGGYAVAAFSEEDVLVTIDMRGTLEGLAVRMAAERGVDDAAMAPLQACLRRIDAALAEADEAALLSIYAEQNADFHAGLAALCGSAPLLRQIERVKALPFASPSALVALSGDARATFAVAQHQHRALLDAVRQRQSARAEALAREHARIAMGNLSLAFGTAARGRPAAHPLSAAG